MRGLYDAAGRADRLTVLLTDVAATEATHTRLIARLRAAGFDVEIKTWNELSAFYSQVRGMSTWSLRSFSASSSRWC